MHALKVDRTVVARRGERGARKAFSAPRKTLHAFQEAVKEGDLVTIQAAIHPETLNKTLDLLKRGCGECPANKEILGAWKSQIKWIRLGSKSEDTGCERHYGLEGLMARAGRYVGAGNITFHKRNSEWLLKDLFCTTIRM